MINNSKKEKLEAQILNQEPTQYKVCTSGSDILIFINVLKT